MKITPQEQTRMLRTLRDAIKIVESFEVKKDCASCEYWDGACTKFGSTPPEHVQKKGCEHWASDQIPF